MQFHSTLFALGSALVAAGVFAAADAPPAPPAPAGDAPGATAPDRTETKGEVDARKPAAKKYPDQDPALGALEGKILFEGDIPKIPPKLIPPEHNDRAACAAHVKEERLVVSDKKELKDVVVSVFGYKPVEKPKPRAIELDNKNCTYVPHVQATTVGSTLKVSNSDGFIHNWHASLAVQKNMAIPAGGSHTEKLPREGWAVITCDFHTWMGAHIKIFGHDLFDVTGEDGTFKIPNIPPGEHQIELWHEYPVEQGKKVKVKVEAGKTTRLDVSMKSGIK